MAAISTIDSVEFYMGRAADDTGWNLRVQIHAPTTGGYGADPNLGTLLGSKTISIENVPLVANKDWVVFTFDTPITAASTGFYSIHLSNDAPSSYASASVNTYLTDDWVDASGGAPLAGDERKHESSGGAWLEYGGSIAYRINCSNTVDNESESPTATADPFPAAGLDYGFGVRTYLTAVFSGAVPTKASTPTPANSATGVDFSGLQLSWVDGGGADTFDVYIGTTGSPTLVSSAQAGTTYTTTMAELEAILGTDEETGKIEQKIYWRIDSTNDEGTTTGDEWNFDPRPTKASNASPTHEMTDMTLDWQVFSWDEVTNADTYDVYMGTSLGPDPVSNMELILDDSPDFSMAQAYMATVTNLVYPNTGQAVYDYDYYWRVDTKNIFGTTTGDDWKFTTIAFDPIRPSYILISGGSGYGPWDGGVEGTDWSWTGENNMITVRRLVAAAANKFWYEEI